MAKNFGAPQMPFLQYCLEFSEHEQIKILKVGTIFAGANFLGRQLGFTRIGFRTLKLERF